MVKAFLKTLNEQIGQRVRLRRVMLGVSQTELAQSLGVSFQQIQKYEQGSNRMSASALYQVSRVLEREVLWFYEGCEESAPLLSGLSAVGGEGVSSAAMSPTEMGLLIQHFSRIRCPHDRARLLLMLKAFGSSV